ncbi:hypothetical protein OpiT1DRAFT_03681 [Opitutaceae bacterium TAV1]|nr:hypothetical protein OpiT1DRAFT_03681 [Opitutaceae bacterium TAV1]
MPVMLDLARLLRVVMFRRMVRISKAKEGKAESPPPPAAAFPLP